MKKNIGWIIIILVVILVVVALSLGESPDIVSHFISALLMIAIPIALWIGLAHTFKLGWRLFFIGALTFIISQVFHIPFNSLVLNPLIKAMGWQMLPGSAQLAIISVLLGLSAGLFENITRYIMLRTWAKGARSWEQGLLFGAGHGGGEAIILGALALVTFFRTLALRGIDLATVFPADQVATAQAQINAYFSTPWYLVLLTPLERVWAICLHLFNTLLVVRSINRRNLAWLAAAILMHSFMDSFAVFSITTWGFVPTEAVLAVIGLICLWLIFILRRKMPSTMNSTPPEKMLEPVEVSGDSPTDEPTREQIDASRFG